MKKLLFAALCGIALALVAQEPLLRVGLMTDTHIGKTEKQCQNIKNAFELFKSKKIDLMIHLGDIANYHYKTGYEIARRYINEIFSEKKPKELWVYANHDMLNRPKETWVKELKEELQIPNEPYDKLVLKGYPFLIFPQWVDLKRQESMIQQAIKEYPGKPVFVLDHVPAAYTTENSGVWGHRARRELLDKYPQTIQFSGHTHNSMRNERCIWQGKFTAVNCGCMQVWDGDLIGTAPEDKRSDEVVIMEIFPGKILFRCYSATDGKEIRPERPWSIPWPFDPEKAPYNPEKLVKISPKPQFEKSAKVTMKADKMPFEKLSFTFPEARHPEKCYRYMLTLNRKDKTGAWKVLTIKETYGNFWKAVDSGTLSIDFSSGFFEENGEYQLEILPRNYYGGTGTPLHFEFKAPKPQQGKVLFESKDPMKELPFLLDLAGNKPVRRKGDFYLYPGGNTRLELPKGIWEGKRGTKFRFIIDLALEQPKNSSWTVVMRNPEPLANANARISTPRKSDNQRIVIDFIKRNEKFNNYYFLLREGLPGKVAFKYVRVEKLSN